MIEESRNQNPNPNPVSVILIGNKNDLEEHRTVSETEGRTLAKRYGWLFGETSAAEYDGVDEIFCHLIREMRAKPATDLSSSSSDTESLTEDVTSHSKHTHFIKRKLMSSLNHKKIFFHPT